MESLKIEAPKGYVIDKEKSTFETIVFKKKEAIETLQDAIEALGENDFEVKELRKLERAGIDSHILYSQQATIIIKAVNDGWVADWNDNSQYKYFIWWDMRTSSFGFYGYFDWHTGSDVSSRFALKNSELTKYVATQFKDIFRKAMV